MWFYFHDMAFIQIIIMSIMISQPTIIFDFHPQADLTSWRVVNDGVMGGLSKGTFTVNELGYGEFKGMVSLENNGGFSSVRYRFQHQSIPTDQSFLIRIKGDGKSYQFRVKSSQYDRHSYTYGIDTDGNWQVIEIPFSELAPTFRGNRLDMPNYPGKNMEEVAFLIGNKKAEEFLLEIDWIKIK